MTVKEFREQLKDKDDDMEVFIRCTTNPCGNIVDAEEVSETTYGFFGSSIPCIIIEPGK